MKFDQRKWSPLYGYYQSRFGSLGLSYRGVPMPLKAQIFSLVPKGGSPLPYFRVLTIAAEDLLLLQPPRVALKM